MRKLPIVVPWAWRNRQPIRMLSPAASVSWAHSAATAASSPRHWRGWSKRATAGRGWTQPSQLARTLVEMGEVHYRMGDCTMARRTIVDGLAIARAEHDPTASAHGLNNLGIIDLLHGEHAAAQVLFKESLSLSRESGDKWMASVALCNLGLTAIYQGDHAAARAWLEESLTLFNEMGEKQGIAVSLMMTGHVARAEGDHEAARTLYARGLVQSYEVGDRYNMADSLVGLAGVAAEMDRDIPRAARLAGAAAALRASIGATVEPFERDIYERAVGAAQAALGEEAFAAAFAAGQRMTLDEAVAYALGEDIR